tara:strand:+ start:1616 stop:2044 length:429 start_codon:yes stop_codon:yes gene_type:complete
MVAENKYKTLDGSVMEEAEAKELFGDDLETMIDLGQIEIVGEDAEETTVPIVEETGAQEEVQSDTYITNDGTELTTEEAMDYFGDSLEDMVSLGQLKKKNQAWLRIPFPWKAILLRLKNQLRRMSKYRSPHLRMKLLLPNPQ